MSSVLLIQTLVMGILLGGLYAIMAQGLALAWGVLNIVNLAHGAFIILGAYLTMSIVNLTGLDPMIGLIPVAVVMFGLGYMTQRGLLNLVVRGPMFNTLLIAFGLEVIIADIIQHFYSADFQTINSIWVSGSTTMGGMTIPKVNLATFMVAFALNIVMWLFLLRTKLGRAIRATAQNLVAARLYGVEPRHLYAVTFGIGIALAGMAGGLYGMAYSFTPALGVFLTAKCFAITIIGGLDNPLGVIVGGLLLGIIEMLTMQYIGSTYQNVASFGVLVLVLILRPNGLLGKTA